MYEFFLFIIQCIGALAVSTALALPLWIKIKQFNTSDYLHFFIYPLFLIGCVFVQSLIFTVVDFNIINIAVQVVAISILTPINIKFLDKYYNRKRRMR